MEKLHTLTAGLNVEGEVGKLGDVGERGCPAVVHGVASALGRHFL